MSCQSLSKFTESMSHCSFRLIVRLLCVIKILLVKYECLNVFLSSRQMSQHGHQSDVSYSKMFYAKSVKQHWCCKTVNIAVSFATQTQILKCATMEAQPGAAPYYFRHVPLFEIFNSIDYRLTLYTNAFLFNLKPIQLTRR